MHETVSPIEPKNIHERRKEEIKNLPTIAYLVNFHTSGLSAKNQADRIEAKKELEKIESDPLGFFQQIIQSTLTHFVGKKEAQETIDQINAINSKYNKEGDVPAGPVSQVAEADDDTEVADVSHADERPKLEIKTKPRISFGRKLKPEDFKE